MDDSIFKEHILHSQLVNYHFKVHPVWLLKLV